MNELYVGLMSGTSMDGVDAALVEFDNDKLKLIASHYHAIPDTLKEKLKQLSQDTRDSSIDELGEVDNELGYLFAKATQVLLKSIHIKPEQVTAIGSHGQTIRHRPDLKNRFTLQIADPNIISYQTGITTVADFRRKDMAANGEGAPLAPAFHKKIFHSSKEDRAILNIGGISNLTYLPKNSEHACFGFDCGPGSALMDAWTFKHHNKNFDVNGSWAAASRPDEELLALLMQDTFIYQQPPKSTGKEHYNMKWLQQQLDKVEPLSADTVQATLCQFTCDSIVSAVKKLLPNVDRLIVCGGGAHNLHLMSLLEHKLINPNIDVDSSSLYGVSPDWVEAIAFAWLARQTLQGLPGNLPAVTGADRPLVLGSITPA